MSGKPDSANRRRRSTDANEDTMTQFCEEQRSPKRRDMLVGLAALAMTASAAATDAFAEPALPPRRIDVHHHTVPPRILERTRAALLAGSPYGEEVARWTPE